MPGAARASVTTSSCRRAADAKARHSVHVTIWLITREPSDAHAQRVFLEARGLQAIEVPCIESRLRRWPWHGSAPLTFFTSRRAVEAWREGGRPPLHAVASLARNTAAALEAAGVVPQIVSDGGAVELAEAVFAAGPFVHTHYPTSNAALSSAEQLEAITILRRMGQVDRQVVYEVHAPPALAARLDEATTGRWAGVFSSPSAVKNLLAAAAPSRRPERAICIGRSTAHAWDQSKFDGWPAALHARTLEEAFS